jgi:hypothetical protein
MQDDFDEEGGGNDPGVEPGEGREPPDDPGLEDMRPEPHDVEPEA